MSQEVKGDNMEWIRSSEVEEGNIVTLNTFPFVSYIIVGKDKYHVWMMINGNDEVGVLREEFDKRGYIKLV